MFFICWDDYNQDRTPQKGGCVHARTMFAAVPPGMDICVHLCGDSGWRTESVQFSAGACCNPFSEGCRGQITLREGRREPPSPFLLRNIAKVEHQVFHRDIYAVFGRFPSGKTKTSDFLRANIRGFVSKVRMFMPKKSDVFGRL